MKRILMAALFIAAALASSSVHAADFYKGKTVTYIVATNPGGGYDTYGRLIAKYLKKHLGARRVLVRNIPGAGHIVGTNTLWASKADGLTIGTFNTGLIYAQILERKGVQFDLTKFEWIGKAAADPRVLIISAKSGLKSFQDLVDADKPVKFATAGVGSASYTDTNLLASAFGLNIEVITGFTGNEGEMAMLRGEIAAQVGSMSSLQGFVDNGYGFIALAIGADVEGVPHVLEVAETPRAKSIVALIQAMSQLGRLTAAPPGTPADRVKELRDAYANSLADPDLLAEAKKMGRPIEPASGEEVASLIKQALDQSPETVAIIAKAVNVEIPTRTVTAELLTLSDDSKWITFKDDGETVKAKISGSRTKLKIDGADADRTQLSAGMTCTIEYDPENERNEPKTMDCKS